MIEAINITKYFGDKLALDNVSFGVRSGEICGYLGPNGAGKTTTIKILTGIIPPTSGTAIINGIDVRKHPDKIKRQIGYVPESGAVFEVMTPVEFLRFVGRIYGLDDEIIERRSGEFLEIFEIREYMNEPMSSFSRGMKQKVLIISALIHNPSVILLDEPLEGLDAMAVLILKELLKKFAEQGRTIFYSSHLLDVVEKLCDRLIIINRGKIIASGEISEILKLTSESSLSGAFTKITNSEDPDAKIREFISKLENL
jgi:ABC-2 type transport system ATP-binding protein